MNTSTNNICRPTSEEIERTLAPVNFEVGDKSNGAGSRNLMFSQNSLNF